MSNEFEHVNQISHWYVSDQLRFDQKLIELRYRTIKKSLTGKYGLELGPAEGSMTQYLINDFQHLTVVEGSSMLLDRMPNYENVTKINSLFEDYNPVQKFDSIIMEHILEHIKNPIELITKAKNWLSAEGKIFIGVPNGDSIHRLAGVKMGLLNDKCSLNERDHQVGHRRVYTKESLKADIEACGLNILEFGGVFLKPVSNKQIDENWTNEMVEAFFQLGKDFPDLCAEIFYVCKNSD
jgi:2-polyprenyl-3-methyl-5-hydroxy-6-metoxy-1,4-benzoquinol methylase